MIKRIGVELKEGCDIPGGDMAIKSLGDLLDFDEIISIDPSLIKKENPLYVTAVNELNHRLKDCVRKTLDEGHFPLVFGGDHALAIGSISATLTKDTGVLWIDAHGDCNTIESSPSHRIHGMPLAILQGHGHSKMNKINDVVLKAQDILQIGIRSLDQQEEIQMRQWGVRFITTQEITTKGFEWMISEVMAFFKAHPRMHVSFDCDSVDPFEAPGVNTPSRNGLTIDQVMTVLNAIPFDKVSSMDIVEYNPLRDNGKTKAMIIAVDALVSAKKG